MSLAQDTRDIREVIFSADGLKVSRWESLDNKIHTGPGQGDDSHLFHTHVSFYRDSEARDKTAVFRRFFEERDVRITAIKGEDWKPTKNAISGESNGVLRAVPDRAAAVVARVPLDGVIRSIAEVTSFGGGNWRLTKFEGKTLFMLRSDFTPLVQNGDAAVDKALSDYIARV
jgi:hypothetical protein